MYNSIQTSERSEQVNDDAIDNQQPPVQRTRPAMVEQHHERLKRRSPALHSSGKPTMGLDPTKTSSRIAQSLSN